MVTRLLRSLLGAGRRLADRKRGVSAVEFALILPIMLMLYAGSVELSEALSVDRKTNRVASTIGDLVTQQTSMTQTVMDGFFAASSAVMRPYPTGTRLSILVMAVNIDPHQVQTVAWAKTNHASDIPPAAGSTPPIAVPTALATPSSQVIVTRAVYVYESPFSNFTQGLMGRSTPGYTLSHVFTMKPRSGTSIPFS